MRIEKSAKNRATPSFRGAHSAKLNERTRNPETGHRASGFRVRSPSDKIDFVNFARGSRPGMTANLTALMILTVASAFALPQIASAETVLRIGMTAADIPRTLG